MNSSKAVFSTACLPSIAYFSELSKYKMVWMESCENFVKQTNRNRYHIAAPSGLQSLFIPVVQQHLNSTPIKEVKIAYDAPWQRTQWRSITSAYNRSAYFEYYADELEPLFIKNYLYLLDFNSTLLDWILRKLKVSITFEPTTTFQKKCDDQTLDFRKISNSKNNINTSNFPMKKYPQAFEYKNGFIENLSILDLLFNVGPVASEYI